VWRNVLLCERTTHPVPFDGFLINSFSFIHLWGNANPQRTIRIVPSRLNTMHAANDCALFALASQFSTIQRQPAAEDDVCKSLEEHSH
jgi:hypothetical protein